MIWVEPLQWIFSYSKKSIDRCDPLTYDIFINYLRLNLFYFFSRTARAPDQLRCRWFMFVHKNFGDYRKTFAEFWNRLFLFWWNFHLVFFFSAFPMIDRSPWVYDINWNAQRVRIPILFSSYELFWELLERKLSERWICSAAVNVSRCDEMLLAIE